MNTPRTTLYRDKQNAKVFGICSGIGDYTGVNPLWVRLGAIGLTILTSGFTIPCYFIAGVLLNKKPAHLYVEEEEKKYWQGVRQNPKRAAREVRSRMREVDRRLARVEEHYVSSNPRLTAEIDRLR